MGIFIIKESNMNFKTRVDFTNRQTKQNERMNINLSGTTTFGLPYSAMTSGPDLTNPIVVYDDAVLQSTYYGNASTTTYTFGDSRMTLAEGMLTVLTPSNSGDTQNVYSNWIGHDMFTTVDGYTGWTSYSAVTYDLDVVTMVNLGGGYYSGITQSDFMVYNTNSLDYTGSTTWVDVSGITRTDELVVSKGPVIGHVLTCIDSTGKVSWAPSSSTGSTSGATFWETSGISGNSLNSINTYNTVFGTSEYSFIGGGRSGYVVNSNYSAIVGGQSPNISNSNFSFIGGGLGAGISGGHSSFVGSGGANISDSIYSFSTGGKNSIDSSSGATIVGGLEVDAGTIYGSINCSIIGGSNNSLYNSTNSAIIGGELAILSNVENTVIVGGGGTGTIVANQSNMVYVPDLIINDLNSVEMIGTDASGKLVNNTALLSTIKLLEYTPTSSADTFGTIGRLTWNDSYIYIKTNVGWKRLSLGTF